MGSKIFFSGLALSGLGLGYFLPVVLPVGAVVVVVGIILIWLDK